MKCKNCGEKLKNRALKCPSCGAENAGFRFGGANSFMLVLALLQAAFLTFIVVNLVNGSFIKHYIEEKNYTKAAELIDMFSFISDGEKTDAMAAEAINSIKQDYFDEKYDFDEADKNISSFTEITSGDCKKMASEAAEEILQIQNARENVGLGNKALNDGDFASAIMYYELIGEADVKYYPVKDELIDGVYKAIALYLDDIVGELSYEDAVAEASRLRSTSKTQEFAQRMSTIENNYIYKWICQCEKEGNFFGENSAMTLSLWYGQKIGSTDEVGKIYMNYVNYLNQFTTDGYYRTALDKMNADFPEIEKYSNMLNVSNFEAMRRYYANCLLEKSRAEGNYTGRDGAIAVSRELNGYGAESQTDINSIINEYAEQERKEFIAWLNGQRESRGLSVMKDDADLEKAATAMISENGESIYNDITFENNMDKYKIDYSYANTLTIMDCRDSEAFITDIGNSDTVFGIITEPGLNKIGVGMRFDQETETFSWFVIGIKNPPA